MEPRNNSKYGQCHWPTEVNSTMLQEYLSCKRRARWMMEHGLGRPDSEKMQQGRAIHEMLARRYTMDELRPRSKQTREWQHQLYPALAPIMDAYEEAMPKPHFPGRVYAVEYPFALDLHGICFTGVIDLLLGTDDGFILVEHKTTSRTQPLPWTLNQQVLGYAWAVQQLWHAPVKLVYWNFIHLPRTPKAKPFFNRHAAVVEPWVVAEWEDAMVSVADDLLQERDEPNYWACVNPVTGFVCPFQDICLSPEWTRREMLMALRRSQEMQVDLGATQSTE